MTICSLRNDNLLSRCVYSDILNRKFPPKKPFRPENSDCTECVTFSLPRIKFNLSSGARHIKREEVLLPVAVRRSKTPELKLNFIRATKTSRIPRYLNFLGETAFWGGIFCLEYPSRHSEKVNCHFANYRLSFRKLQIVISQTADFHFANYRFSFRKLQIFISQTTDFHFANYRFSFRKLQIVILQTTDSHFANYRFSFRFVSLHFVWQTTVSPKRPYFIILIHFI